MHPAPLRPETHVFVCANRRAESDPLGGGCSDRGEEVYRDVKSEVAKRGLFRAVWVTKTYCLGVCPKRGATVAVYGGGRQEVLTEVEPSDAPSLLARVPS